MAAAEPGELAAAREKILRATLVHVPFNGWSVTALEHGIRDSGVEGAPARLAFQGGMAEVAEYYSRFADERMLAALDNDAVVKMPIRARITHVLRVRLEQAETEREAVRSLMSWLALPGNQALGAKCLYRAVDTMWHGAGDTSTDFNFYSKRAMLAGILAATVLYWLVDDSEGREATWVFLDRRVDDVLGIEKAKARVRAALSKLPDPFNILKRGFPGDRPPGA